jgi:uncharacterized protein (DUF2336 family)
VWSRSDIPRQHLLALFQMASETVRSQLHTANRAKAELYTSMIAQAASQVQAETREHSPRFLLAREHVQSLRDAGSLSEANVKAFARAGQFDEMTVALSCMCSLPIDLVERAMMHDQVDQIMVIAKSIGLSWDTLVSVLATRAVGGNCSKEELERHRTGFAKLQQKTAMAALRFYGLRMRAMAPSK